MSSAAWFYALDDVERGPVTLSQLRGLIAAGKLGPDDLVWTEGMADWKPLQAVPGLRRQESPAASAPLVHVADARTASPPAPPAPSKIPVPETRSTSLADASSPPPPPAALPTAPPQTAPRRPEVAGQDLVSSPLVRRVLLGLGLLLVLTAQGCELLGNRYAHRLVALELLAAKPDLPPAKPGRTDSETAPATSWESPTVARQVLAQQQAWSYWRALLLVGGTLVMGVGLVLGAWTSDGAERWACWLLLAVLLYCVLGGASGWQALPAP